MDLIKQCACAIYNYYPKYNTLQNSSIQIQFNNITINFKC